MSSLTLRGAREHNLRDLDLELPLGRWIAVVGPSGSGKTSLVFETLVKEGQRRYLGSLSARARQVLGKLGHADADAIEGLPVAVAVGQRALTAHARSTVGTLTGALDLLRLLLAREAMDPGGEALSRSHFSFNHPLGACPACKGLGQEDLVDPDLLVADANKSLRDGALRPTLKNGYTVYSQVTLAVMDQICRAHGFDVDTPWRELTEAQRGVVLYGTQALKVPFGKHSIESRMKWEGITARPREEGHYRGIVPVIRETLKRDRNPNILRYVRSVDCSACQGSRLARPGREAVLAGHTLPGLLALPVERLLPVLRALPATPVWTVLEPALRGRLDRMVHLGLGHLALSRGSESLSGGEGQRVRLAAQLAAGLGGMLVALDEPTLGLHPDSQQGMRAVLDELRGLGNTLLVVEHDPDMVRFAEHLVELGPGAGPEGGEVLYAGPSVQPHPLGRPPAPRSSVREGQGRLLLTGASLHNLQSARLEVRLGAFNVVTGPSGAGKSSLVFGTLLPALRGERGGDFEALEGDLGGLSVRAVDAQPIGRTPRSTPATWSGLFEGVRARFAATPEARALGLSASRFSFNTQAGRCARCEGLGSLRVGLHLLEDVELPCPRCGGGRYDDEVLEVRLRGRSVAEVLAMTVLEALAFFSEDPPLAAICQAMADLGLGHMRLGQSSTTLSRGEAQRVKLATLIGKAAGPSLLVMDEPDRGLHPQDVARLLRAIDALIGAGHTVLAISHHRHLWAAADHRVELREGRNVAPRPLLAEPGSDLARPRPAAELPAFIRLEGVETNNLRDLDVSIPHGRLTVVAGPSGSGKTSLAFDTLAAESWARFAESLPFQVRRFMRRLPRPKLRAARGLTPTLALRQGQARASRRSTVATQSELGPRLRLLWSRLGLSEGQPCGLSAAHFSPDQSLGACAGCEGVGRVSRCSPERLITDPGASLFEGAMSGTRPGRFFGEPDGQYLATLQAAAGDVDLRRPWSELPPEVQQLALYGAGERALSVTWRFQRGQRSGEHHFEGTWPGLCALVEQEARVRARRKAAAEWAEPLFELACPDCGGGRLGRASRAVRVGGLSLPELMARPLSSVARELVERTASSAPQLVRALLPEVQGRLEDLCALGLGHLSLDRSSPTLSDGELQRIRLASLLGSGLSGLTVVLDEPSAGLHPSAVRGLVRRLQDLRDRGNTVVVVDHRREMVRAADHLLELGPGSGPEGGRVVAQGAPEQVLAGDSLTARALRLAIPPRRSASGPLELRIAGAHLNNLRDLDVELPTSGFVAVSGPSGSGKTSLVFGVLAASALAGGPVGCASVQGLERFVEVRTPGSVGSTPLDAMQLLAPLQALFHGLAGHGLPKRAFSFRSPLGRCPTCKGSGREKVAMDALADLDLPCPACSGRRYRDEVLGVRWDGVDIAGVLEMPVASLASSLPEGKLAQGVRALSRAGLGHLSLGRRSSELSGGERQRLGLARSLLLGASPALHLLDEPARGLHEHDLAQLVHILRELAARGDLVVATEHRGSLIAAADRVIELGPGGGPEGGRLLRQGTC